MIHRFLKVDDGIYRGSSPDVSDVKRLKDDFGIRKIISLDRKSGEKIDRACKLLDIEHVKIYIESRSDLLKLLNYNIKDLLTKGGPVFFHCKYGKDRTGLLAALYEVKYMGVPPNKAIERAKSFGFGIGVPKNISNLYEKIILSCRPALKQDENKADIVSNEREYIGDNRDSFLDEGHQGSFAPYLDHTKKAPMDMLYNSINDQSPTRDNYKRTENEDKNTPDDKTEIPQVGIYNNDAGVVGTGWCLSPGGFIYE